MAIKYFCDRCGNEIKHPDKVEMRTNSDPKKSPTSMDAATFIYVLCRDCTTAVRRFLDTATHLSRPAPRRGRRENP